jgi:hypothetical protein
LLRQCGRCDEKNDTQDDSHEQPPLVTKFAV